MTVLSFSILALILFNCSICSCISALASWCFFFSPTMVASCWILASSRSLLSLVILVLLLQSNNGGLLLDLGLLQVSSQLGHLSLSLLVELNLSAGGSTGLIETLTEVLQLTGEVRSLALSLGSALSLSLKFLPGSLQFRNSFLHNLQFSLNLPSFLLNVGSATLLLLIRALQLIKS